MSTEANVMSEAMGFAAVPTNWKSKPPGKEVKRPDPSQSSEFLVIKY